eukprot:2010757-Alexandrium_andersonii.AAC.2
MCIRDRQHPCGARGETCDGSSEGAGPSSSKARPPTSSNRQLLAARSCANEWAGAGAAGVRAWS